MATGTVTLVEEAWSWAEGAKTLIPTRPSLSMFSTIKAGVVEPELDTTKAGLVSVFNSTDKRPQGVEVARPDLTRPSVVLTINKSVPVADSTSRALEVEVATKKGEAEMTWPMPVASRVKS